MELKIKRGAIKSCFICEDVSDPFTMYTEGGKNSNNSKDTEKLDGFTISRGDDIGSYFNICICEKCMNTIKYGTMVLKDDKSLLSVTTDTCFHEQQ